MKKIGLLFLVVVLIISLAACRGRNDNQQQTVPSTVATTPTTVPATTPVIPEIDPTLETNIPDPNVDTSMPDGNDTTDMTENATGENQGSTGNPTGTNTP